MTFERELKQPTVSTPALSVEQARTLYDTVEDTTHDFDHVLRVYHLCERIGQQEGADLDVVLTAALLHDVARRDQDTGRVKDHALEGARRARSILATEPSEFVGAVADAIATHRFRAQTVPPQTLEAKVLFDSDKLDAIGAVGVARAFSYGAQCGQPLWATAGTQFHSPLQEFEVKAKRTERKVVHPERSRNRRRTTLVHGTLLSEDGGGRYVPVKN